MLVLQELVEIILYNDKEVMWEGSRMQGRHSLQQGRSRDGKSRILCYTLALSRIWQQETGHVSSLDDTS